jgi:hypothetical protein
MQQIEHFAFGALGDDVDDGQLLGNALHDKLKQGGRANSAGAANYCNFHGLDGNGRESILKRLVLLFDGGWEAIAEFLQESILIVCLAAPIVAVDFEQRSRGGLGESEITGAYGLGRGDNADGSFTATLRALDLIAHPAQDA